MMTPDRKGFIAITAALCLKSVAGEVHQREQAQQAKETAEKLADLLGIPEEPEHEMGSRMTALEQLVRDRDTRIRELEEQLEQATAPAASKARRS